MARVARLGTPHPAAQLGTTWGDTPEEAANRGESCGHSVRTWQILLDLWGLDRPICHCAALGAGRGVMRTLKGDTGMSEITAEDLDRMGAEGPIGHRMAVAIALSRVVEGVDQAEILSATDDEIEELLSEVMQARDTGRRACILAKFVRGT